MLFAGIQKLTLLDYPQHVACTLFTQGCGYRCPFCHNSSLLPLGTPEQPMTEETVLACDMAVRIPMTDLVESLNAGVAGSVLLWHFRGV